MTIYKDIKDTRQMEQKYTATSQDVVTVKSPSAVVTTAFCPCDFECEYIEKAFGNNDNGVDEFKNDKTRVLVKLTVLSDVVTFTLVDTLNGNEYDLTSGLYGTYYAPQFAADNPNYTGIEIEWNKVLAIIGSSVYEVRINQTSIGVEYETTTHKYQCIPFNEEFADSTIRIKATHDGFFNEGFDYTSLNWVSYVRIPAKVSKKTPVEEDSDYVQLNGTQRKTSQIQTRTTTEWSVSTELLTSSVYNGLIYDQLKANKVELSDYSLFAKEKLRNLEVKYSGVESDNYLQNSTKAIWTFKFTENIIKLKRNFR